MARSTISWISTASERFDPPMLSVLRLEIVMLNEPAIGHFFPTTSRSFFAISGFSFGISAFRAAVIGGEWAGELDLVVSSALDAVPPDMSASSAALAVVTGFRSQSCIARRQRRAQKTFHAIRRLADSGADVDRFDVFVDRVGGVRLSIAFHGQLSSE
jgi:hypothetical protein